MDQSDVSLDILNFWTDLIDLNRKQRNVLTVRTGEMAVNRLFAPSNTTKQYQAMIKAVFYEWRWKYSRIPS